MCLTEAGNVYSWGRACDGRLGIGKGNDRVPPSDEFEPVLVEWFVKRNITIKQVRTFGFGKIPLYRFFLFLEKHQ